MADRQIARQTFEIVKFDVDIHTTVDYYDESKNHTENSQQYVLFLKDNPINSQLTPHAPITFESVIRLSIFGLNERRGPEKYLYPTW